jgi:hypothetical protein
MGSGHGIRAWDQGSLPPKLALSEVEQGDSRPRERPSHPWLADVARRLSTFFGSVKSELTGGWHEGSRGSVCATDHSHGGKKSIHFGPVLGRGDHGPIT